MIGDDGYVPRAELYQALAVQDTTSGHLFLEMQRKRPNLACDSVVRPATLRC